MPYEIKDNPREFVAWPNRSLSKRGFATFIMITYGLFLLPLFAMIGTMALWGILPYILLVLGLTWAGIQRSWRDGQLREVLTLQGDTVNLVREEPGGQRRNWQANPYWVSVHLHETGGPVPGYVTLKGAGREVEFGAFLSEDERRALYADLQREFG